MIKGDSDDDDDDDDDDGLLAFLVKTMYNMTICVALFISTNMTAFLISQLLQLFSHP